MQVPSRRPGRQTSAGHQAWLDAGKTYAPSCAYDSGPPAFHQSLLTLVRQAVLGRQALQRRQCEQQPENHDESGQNPHGKTTYRLIGDSLHARYGAATEVKSWVQIVFGKG